KRWRLQQEVQPGWSLHGSDAHVRRGYVTQRARLSPAALCHRGPQANPDSYLTHQRACRRLRWTALSTEQSHAPRNQGIAFVPPPSKTLRLLPTMRVLQRPAQTLPTETDAVELAASGPTGFPDARQYARSRARECCATDHRRRPDLVPWSLHRRATCALHHEATRAPSVPQRGSMPDHATAGL